MKVRLPIAKSIPRRRELHSRLIVTLTSARPARFSAVHLQESQKNQRSKEDRVRQRDLNPQQRHRRHLQKGEDVSFLINLLQAVLSYVWQKKS